MKNKDIAIKVENVSKYFQLPHQQTTTLKSFFINPLKLFRKRFTEEQQRTLDGISFDIKKGEFFGIVGRNGSGKSTLLKCIAGVYTPESGKIIINGKLVPFIELGVGFNPELSGRDNVFLNGALLGFSRKQMEAMYDEIVAFSELERFMDQKLKNYSSGMQVRLAFSIAIQAKGDVLLLDEVLAVGDSAFQQKCYDYFAALKEEKRTIIFVSHSMPSVERFCDRAILLEGGVIKKIGTSNEVAAVYEDMMLQEEAQKRSDKLDKEAAEEEEIESDVDAEIVVKQGKNDSKSIEAFKKFDISVKLTSKKHFPKTYIGLNLRNSEGQAVFAVDLYDYIGDVELKKGVEKEIVVSVDNVFTNGTYYFTLGVADSQNTAHRVLLKKRNISSFTVFGVRKNTDSLVHPNFSIKEK